MALLNNDNTWHAIKWQVQLSPPVSDDPEKVRLLLDRLVANGLLTRNDTATNLLTRYISTHSNASLTQRQGSQYLELSVASVSPTRVLRIDQQGSPAFEELTRQFKDSSRQPAWVRFETGIAPTNIYALAEPLFARNLSGQTDSSWPYDMYLRGQDRAEVVYYFRRYDEIGWKIKGPLTGGDALDYDLAQGAIALKTLRRDVTESNNLAIFIIVIIAMLGIGIVAGIVVIVARRRDG